MSGRKEEPLTAADEIVVEPAAADEGQADEPEPANSPGKAAEMTAAEALARVTQAAAPATEPAEPAARAQPAEDADESAATTEPDAAVSATDNSASAPQPEATAEGPAAADDDEEREPATPQAEPAPSAAEEADTPPQADGAPVEAPAAAEHPTVDSEEPAAKKPARAKPKKAPPPERPELRPILEALESRQPVEGRVIGWNNGGFHLALGELSAFCPRSEMEVGENQPPETYLDRVFMFRVLRLQGKGRRIVVSRAAHLRKESLRQRNELRKKLQPGTVLDGTIASLKDFGAFVDLGGAQGLVHVSEISHRRIEHPSHVLSEGQEVKVKVLKVEQGGRRISLSIRALEPDPWKDLADRFPRGAVVQGTVEKANQIGAFIELAPGLTGLLPARSMSIPRETSPARAYPPGKEVSVQIVSVDPRRQRISLALEGSGLEGSTNDYKEYQRRHREEEGEGFNALASAFRRLRDG